MHIKQTEPGADFVLGFPFVGPLGPPQKEVWADTTYM